MKILRREVKGSYFVWVSRKLIHYDHISAETFGQLIFAAVCSVLYFLQSIMYISRYKVICEKINEYNGDTAIYTSNKQLSLQQKRNTSSLHAVKTQFCMQI
jgi:hypothetical protein